MSVPRNIGCVVYVDSGSVDNSLEIAARFDVDTVQLDTSEPFTAARARNLGFARLRAQSMAIEYIQFVDADCELAGGWLETAANALHDQPQLAAVAGRLRERHRDASVYNLLCDIEWDTPIGPAKHFGGNFMIRAAAFEQVGGFAPAIIAAEDSEFCVRLRQHAWRLERLAAEMGTHDAHMLYFRQWWRRAVRTGHAFAEGVELHGRSSERHFVRESASTWIYVCLIPLLALVAAPFTAGLSLLLLLLPIVLVVKIARSARPRLTARKDCWLFALFTVAAKYPQWLGQLLYLGRRLTGKPRTLIEYKGVQS
jgi:GT2 family glycosyltransferase